MASAFFFERRSSISSSFESGRPKMTLRSLARARPRAGSRDGRRLARDQLARAHVAEVRSVRPVDADPPIAGLSALERPPSPDQDSVSRSRRIGTGRSRGPMTRLTGAGGSRRSRNATPAACAQPAPVKAALSAASKHESVTVTAIPATTRMMAASTSRRARSSVSPVASVGSSGDGPVHPGSVSAGGTEPERPPSTNRGMRSGGRSTTAQYLRDRRPSANQFRPSGIESVARSRC